MSAEPAYLDPRTGQRFPLDRPRWRGEGGRPLLLTPLPGMRRADIDAGTRTVWRWRAALPFAPDDPITLGEGGTPLLARRLHGAEALIKCDWLMPSGSFKDRGAAVMLSLLRAQGVRAVLEDSSGNGGAAIAAYAAAGGMRAHVLVPATTSPAKTVQMRAYGAEVELVAGSRQDTADEALRRASNPTSAELYASHNWHPFFLHGTKTLAYEMWEDLGYSAPDNVIVPCGAGSNVLGCQIGFGELLRAGEIRAVPRIFTVQPAACAPVAAAFAAGTDEPGAITAAPTIAEGTAIARPIRLAEVLGALHESRGGAVTLGEGEIAAATLELARLGLCVEPTAAQPSAAFGKLLASGAIAPDQRTVLVLTGSGLKATPRITELLGTPLSIARASP